MRGGGDSVLGMLDTGDGGQEEPGTTQGFPRGQHQEVVVQRVTRLHLKMATKLGNA